MKNAAAMTRSGKDSNMIDAMTEGMPPKDKLSLILNPSNLKDYIVSADVSGESRQFLTKSFTNPWEIYNINKEANSDLDFMSGNNPDRLWQKNVLSIACHLDSGKPLYRVIFWGGGERASSKRSNSDSTTEVETTCTNIILDIERIKIAPSTMYNTETPIICVKFARIDGSGGPMADIVIKSRIDLPGIGSEGVVNLFCSQEEIKSGLSMLEKNSTFIDKGYIKKWKNINKSDFFKPSFLRPALKPVFPYEDQIIEVREGKIHRKNERTIERAKIEEMERKIKADIKALTYKRRYILASVTIVLNYDNLHHYYCLLLIMINIIVIFSFPCHNSYFIASLPCIMSSVL